jgi:hypothetical protein
MGKNPLLPFQFTTNTGNILQLKTKIKSVDCRLIVKPQKSICKKEVLNAFLLT